MQSTAGVVPTAVGARRGIRRALHLEATRGQMLEVRKGDPDGTRVRLARLDSACYNADTQRTGCPLAPSPSRNEDQTLVSPTFA
jgi:hypothetical protein